MSKPENCPAIGNSCESCPADRIREWFEELDLGADGKQRAELGKTMLAFESDNRGTPVTACPKVANLGEVPLELITDIRRGLFAVTEL